MGSSSLTRVWAWSSLHWECGVLANGPPEKCPFPPFNVLVSSDCVLAGGTQKMYSVSWSFIELNGQLDLLFNIRIKKIKNKNPFLRWWQKKCTSASQMWFGARWLCIHSFNIGKSTQLEKHFRELLGMSSSYAIDKEKLSRWLGLGSCIRQGCALARSTGQKQEVGQGNNISELQSWFSGFIWNEGSCHSLLLASTLWWSVRCLMEPVCHEPSWVFLGQQGCFCRVR